jgi:hypothetical protein
MAAPGRNVRVDRGGEGQMRVERAGEREEGKLGTGAARRGVV